MVKCSILFVRLETRAKCSMGEIFEWTPLHCLLHNAIETIYQLFSLYALAHGPQRFSIPFVGKVIDKTKCL